LSSYKKDYRLLSLPKYLKSVLIGILLSDGGLERSSLTSFVRLNVIMSIKSFPYLFHLYNLFEPYTNSDIQILDINKTHNSVREYKTYTTVRFKTVSLPHFLPYYDLFYKEDKTKNKWIKTIGDELKCNFDSIALAHLIMGNGNYLKDRNIIRLYTNSFNKNGVILLSNIIKENLQIDNKVMHDRNNQYIIIIEKNNVNLTSDLVLPYMHPSMYYKLGLNYESDNNFDYSKILNFI
jgi:LAGLIDADG DNA endonuclease family